MKIDTAVTAGQLAAQINAVTAKLAAIDVAINEQWPVSMLRVAAPAQGASQPAGTEVDLLSGSALPIADFWKVAITTARQFHQTELDALNAQLAAL